MRKVDPDMADEHEKAKTSVDEMRNIVYDYNFNVRKKWDPELDE